MLSHRLLALLVLAAGASFVSAPALAQSRACVHLLVGAGYAAQMRIVSGSFATQWSDSFPIGRTMCQSLNDVSDGKTFTVEVHAVLGQTKKCSPENVRRVAASTSSVTFQAWGTTLNVSCQEPTDSASDAMSEAARTPNPAGAEAAKNPKKEL